MIAIRNKLDRVGILLSGLCVVHCVLGFVLVGMVGVGGELFLSPDFHTVGLALALIVGLLSLGFGYMRHARIAPLIIGGFGLSLMGAALLVGHGLPEAILTIIGVCLVAFAHIRNLHAGC